MLDNCAVDSWLVGWWLVELMSKSRAGVVAIVGLDGCRDVTALTITTAIMRIWNLCLFVGHLLMVNFCSHVSY